MTCFRVTVHLPRMALVGTKVVVLLLLGVIKLSAGLLPLLLTKVLKRKGKCLKKFIGKLPY